jgi:putative ABC transport system permease protein
MSLAREIGIAWHRLRRDTALTLVVVLMLATAIAATVTIFSIVHAVLLRPLPFTDPSRVVLAWTRDDARNAPVIEVSLGELREWRARTTSLASLDVFGSVNWSYRITAPGEPFTATYNSVSASFFETLGARPMLGRTFRPEDDAPGAPATVVLSAHLWRRRFSSDPSIVGTWITIGEGSKAQPAEVIGVMPPEFDFPAGAELWAPAVRDMAQYTGNHRPTMEGLRVFYALGRLRDGATPEQVRTDLLRIARTSEMTREETAGGSTVVVKPLLEHFYGAARPALAAISGAATMLLFIACANAAGLLLVRGVARERETAVRLALGATRAQIVRQFIAEATLLVVLAAAAGLALTYVGFDAVVALSPAEVPRLERATVDGAVLLFALGLAAATPFAVGLLPAWQLSRPALADSLKERAGSAAPRAGRARRLLVVGQLAAALVLLISAGLLARSFIALTRLDLGFDPRNVLTFDLHLPEVESPDDPEVRRQRTLVAGLLDQLERIEGVTAAGAIYLRPFSHGPIGMDTRVLIEGQSNSPATTDRSPTANWEAVTPGYFRAMDIRVVQGRAFTSSDDERARLAAIVSQRLASRLWPGVDPIGKRLHLGDAPESARPRWLTVVGVVEDARYRELTDARYDLYLPFRQTLPAVKHYVVRTQGDPLSVVSAIRGTVKRVDARLALENITSMEQIVARTIAPWRFSTIVFTAFSVLALFFATVGLSALIAYAVKQRTREIGIRIALGARPRDVVRLLVREGASLATAGLSIGIPAALLLTRSLSTQLFSVAPTDPPTFVAVAGVLAAASLAATYLPARAAAAVDPVAALRRE